MSIDVHALITKQILAMLEQGVAPWRSPILASSGAGWPQNLASGQKYRGVNVFLLAFTAWAKGYESSSWLTFNQAKAKGGSVKKGEKATTVVFYKPYDKVDKATGESVTIPLLRYYHVFNLSQCEGVADLLSAEREPDRLFTPIESAEAVVKLYRNGPKLCHEGTQAYYRPLMDSVHIPAPGRFQSPEAYYATLFHELAHSTGHSSRLDRGLDTKLAPFGTPDYGQEELIAELCAALIAGSCGIAPVTIENQAAYLQGWIKALKGDKRLVIGAAGAAQRAADWIHDIRPQQSSEIA